MTNQFTPHDPDYSEIMEEQPHYQRRFEDGMRDGNWVKALVAASELQAQLAAATSWIINHKLGKQ